MSDLLSWLLGLCVANEVIALAFAIVVICVIFKVSRDIRDLGEDPWEAWGPSDTTRWSVDKKKENTHDDK